MQELILNQHIAEYWETQFIIFCIFDKIFFLIKKSVIFQEKFEPVNSNVLNDLGEQGRFISGPG